MDSEKDSSTIWDQLSDKEKAIMTIYKTKLSVDAPFGSIKNLIIEANKIHEKHPLFSVSDIP